MATPRLSALVLPLLGALAAAADPADLPVVRLAATGATAPMRWGVLGHNLPADDWHGRPAPWNTRPVLWDPAAKAPDPAFAPLTGAYPLHWLRVHTDNDYRWRDVVGPVEQRKPLVLQWNQRSQVEPGFDDLLRWAESLPRPPAVSVIVGPLQPVDYLRDWVLYMNAESGPMAELRTANGHPRPYGVKIIELGNEVDWKGREDVDIMRADKDREKAGMMRAEDYVRLFKPRVEALRAADPSLRLYAHAKTSPWPQQNPKWAEWHRTVMAGLGGLIDGIVLHPYYDGYPVPVAMRSVDVLIADIRAYNATASRPLTVWLSEHGKWWENRNDGQTWGLSGAISVGDWLIGCLERPEIEAANAWCYAHHGPWRVIDRDPKTGRCFGTGLHQLYRLLNAAALPEIRPLRAAMPAGITASYGYLANAIWFRDPASGRQALVAINRSPDQALRLAGAIPLALAADATRLLVTGESLGVTCTPATPDAVTFSESAERLSPGADGTVQVVLPPRCVAAWLWR